MNFSQKLLFNFENMKTFFFVDKKGRSIDIQPKGWPISVIPGYGLADTNVKAHAM